MFGITYNELETIKPGHPTTHLGESWGTYHLRVASYLPSLRRREGEYSPSHYPSRDPRVTGLTRLCPLIFLMTLLRGLDVPKVKFTRVSIDIGFAANCKATEVVQRYQCRETFIVKEV